MSDDVVSSDISWSTRGVRAGLRLGLPMALSVATYGVVFGVLARQAGVTFVETLLMNILVFAGSAQLTSLSQWHYPLPILSIVITVLLINLRLLMLGASLRPWLSRFSARATYPTLYFLSDESWAAAMSRYRVGERDAGVLVGTNLSIVLAWIPSVAIGHLAGTAIGDPAALGLDFAFTAVFASMLLGGYSSRFDLIPWTVAAAVATIVWSVIPGTWYIIAGGLAGLIVAYKWAPVAPDPPVDADGNMP